MSTTDNSTRRQRRLSPAAHAKLLEVAMRRLDGESWPSVADSMGWKSRQAARQWSTKNMRRYWSTLLEVDQMRGGLAALRAGREAHERSAEAAPLDVEAIRARLNALHKEHRMKWGQENARGIDLFANIIATDLLADLPEREGTDR